jgi:hypothetical protein
VNDKGVIHTQKQDNNRYNFNIGDKCFSRNSSDNSFNYIQYSARPNKRVSFEDNRYNRNFNNRFNNEFNPHFSQSPKDHQDENVQSVRQEINQMHDKFSNMKNLISEFLSRLSGSENSNPGFNANTNNVGSSSSQQKPNNQ